MTSPITPRVSGLSLSTRITLGVLLLFSLVTLIQVYFITRTEHIHALVTLEGRLAAKSVSKAAEFQRSVEALRRDVLFLSNTPPVQGIVRATLNHGFDPQEDSKLEIWKKRLNEIFTAFLNANPGYYQISYIGVADGGRELIRTDNMGGHVVAIPQDRLQQKGDRDYFLATLQRKPGEIYLSEINLNRKQGKVEVPHKRTFRAATPIYTPGGELFGMIVINLDVGSALDKLAEDMSDSIRAYMVNDKGDYLAHPDPSRIFGFDLGKRYRWQDDVTATQKVEDRTAGAPGRLQEFILSNEKLYGVQQVVHFDPQQPQRSMTLTYAMPDAVIGQSIARTRNRVIASTLEVAALISLMFLLLMRRAFTPLQQLKMAADEVGAGRYDTPLPEIRGGEVGVLATAFRTMLERIRMRDREIKQSNADLAHSESFANFIVNSVPEAILVVDDNGCISRSNLRVEPIFGYLPNELLGQSIETLIPERFRAHHPALRQGYATEDRLRMMGEGHGLEFFGQHRDGHEIPMEVGLVTLMIDEVHHVIVSIADISERKAAEEKMLRDREQQATLRELLETTLMGRILEQTLKQCLEKLLAISWLSIMPKGGILLSEKNEQRLRMVVSQNLSPEIQSMCAEVSYWHCLCGRAAASAEIQFASHVDERHENVYGGIQDHGHYNLPLKTDGQVVGVLVLYLPPGISREPEQENFLASVASIMAGYISRNVGEQALVEHKAHLEEEVAARTTELRETEETIRLILDSTEDGIVVLGSNNQVIHANQRFRDMWRIQDAFPGADNHQLLAILQEQLVDPQAFRDEVMCLYDGDEERTDVLHFKDGRIFERFTRPLVIGRQRGRLWSFYDITERKKVEEAILAASRAKSEFLANMSHEIRTPMNGVVGMVDILQQTELNHDQQRMVGTIQDSSLALLNILNDILDFSKIEAGKLEIERMPTPLREVAEGAAQLMATAANAKSVDLSVFVSPQLPHWIASDPTRLRQVLLNLLGNAVKFTTSEGGRPGKVALRAEHAMLADGRPGVQLRIIDNGIGMSPETLVKLFQPFSQADESTSRKFGGTGLGLSISQRLVEMMGGRIAVRSTLGEGTEFSVELPLEETAPVRQIVPEPDLTGVHVLVVAGNTETLTAYCRAAGADVTVAADLAAARLRLQQAQLSPQTQPSPATIVLLLGLDVTTENEHDLPDAVRVVQLVLRGRSILAAKAVPVHTRPLLYRDLIHGVAIASGRMKASDIAALTERRRQPRITPPTIEEALAAKRLILLAEDNETNREVVQEQLRLLGYIAETAEDGVVALEMWRTGHYALLLTDCHMPHMDGFELTAAIRREEAQGTHRPIIAVTANAMQGESERCIARGMDDYLSKPLRLDELGAMLVKWLPLPRAVAAEETAAKDPGSEPGSHAPVTARFPVWDATALTRMVGDNPDMHRRLLEKFLVKAREQVAVILSAAAAGDVAMVCSVAHTFKSAARTVGAMQLGELCQEMEMAGKAGDGETCQALAGRLSGVFDAAEKAIQSQLAA